MAYIGKTPSSGIRNRFIYTATAGQTTFSGTDDHSRTLSYTDAEFTDVFLNGVKLDKSDYTATSGTSIVLDEGAAVDDILEVLAFDTFSVFSGEFSQDVTVGADLTVDGTITAGAGTHTIGDGTGGSQVILKASASTNSTIDFGDPDDTNIGRIQYNNTDNAMLFRTNNSERLRIDSSGNVGIGTSSPLLTASGRGNLTINGTSDAILTLGINGTYKGYMWANSTKLEFDAGGTGRLIQFNTTGNPRMIIDSSGNVLVGQTSLNYNAVGGSLASDGTLRACVDGGLVAAFNRKTSIGTIANFYKDGTTCGSIGTSDGVTIYTVASNAGGMRFTYYNSTNAAIVPCTLTGNNANNLHDLGVAAAPWRDIYTVGAVNTSDQNEKQQIAELTAPELAAAKRISALFKTFKWNDAVAEKGDNARTHSGVIAQDVRDALIAEGLDAAKYAFWCSNTWWETQTEVPAVEADEENGIEAQDAYTRTDTYDTAEEAPEGATERTLQSVRYNELLAFVGAATEQRLADIETRLTALEAN